MRFYLPASALLLGSILVNAIAIPVSHGDALGVRVSGLSTPEVPYLAPSLEDSTRNLSARAAKKAQKTKSKPKKAKAKPKAKPKTPKAKPKKPKKKVEAWQKPVPTESEIMKKCTVPKNKALFWSGVSDTVYDYNKQAKLTTDEDAYPKGYLFVYSKKDPKKQQLFADRFSRVFAKKAAGTVHLMVPWATGPNPTRVFNKHEWPILKKSLKTGRVTKVIQVNPKNPKETREYDPKKYGLSRRDLGARAAEIDLDNAAWDVDLDVLDEAWRMANKE